MQVHCVSALALFCFIQLNILSQVSFSLAHKHYITEDNLLLSGSFVCLPYHLHPRQSASTSSFAGAACQCFPFMFCKHTLLHIVSPFYRNLTCCFCAKATVTVSVCSVSITLHLARTPHRHHHRATGHVLSISVISVWHRCPNLLLSNQHT